MSVAARRTTGPRRGVIRGVVLFVVALGVLYIADGSRQPTSGSGWQIVGYQRGLGEPNTVVAVPDQAALAAAWEKLRLHGLPAADFARTAVYWFTGVGSVGCPAHFAGIRIDAGRRTLAAVLTGALTAGCDARRVADSFIVAIDRERLPPPPYRVLLADPLPPDAPAAQIEVTG